MVVSRCRRYLDHTGPRISQQPILALQRLDDCRARSGLDQHKNHFGCGLLRGYNPNWDRETLARKGSHGPNAQSGPGQLPSHPAPPSAITSIKTVLKQFPSPIGKKMFFPTALKKIIANVPGCRTIDGYMRYHYTGNRSPELYTRGDYYSPLPDISEVQLRAPTLFRKDVDLGRSIDIRPQMQKQLVTELARYYSDFQWPEQPSQQFRFHFGQDYFCHGDAVILHAMLRHFKPQRVIEAGSGFTSALMLDTDERFLRARTEFTFIEPFPERLLSLTRDSDFERCTLIRDRLQNAPLGLFQQLEANDILFVDSSHVSKIGSDVNYLLFEILPILNPGVFVHFHDILWPFEYPLEWVMAGRAWNEAYMLRAFLQYNSHFEVVLLNSFVGHAFQALMAEKMPAFLKDPGGSLWLRKIA